MSNSWAVENTERSASFQRSRAVAADAVSAARAELGTLYVELMAGNVKIEDSFCTENRSYLVLSLPQPGHRTEPQPRYTREILERVLTGECQKAVAVDLGVSPSTITVRLAECLNALGLCCRASNVPVLLLMALYAAEERPVPREVRLSAASEGGAVYAVVSAPRPEPPPEALLSTSEREVLRLLIQGRTRSEIARQRGTSKRTVANQLCSAFAKLNVSGRVQLLNRLLSRSPCELEEDAPAEVTQVRTISRGLGILESPGSSLAPQLSSSEERCA